MSEPEVTIELPTSPTLWSRVKKVNRKVLIGASIAFTAVVSALVTRSLSNTDSSEEESSDSFDNYDNLDPIEADSNV